MYPLADNVDITIYEDLDYISEEKLEDEARNDDIVVKNVIKKGITRLHKFRNEHGKRVKIPLTIDDVGMISGTN